MIRKEGHRYRQAVHQLPVPELMKEFDLKQQLADGCSGLRDQSARPLLLCTSDLDTLAIQD